MLYENSGYFNNYFNKSKSLIRFYLEKKSNSFYCNATGVLIVKLLVPISSVCTPFFPEEYQIV